MFYTISPAAVEVTRATSFTAGFADILSDKAQVRGLPDVATARRELFGYVSGMAGRCGEFFVCASGVVANETVNVGFGFKVKGFVCPAITNVTRGATGFVGINGDTEVIDDIGFTEKVAIFGVCIFPCPVGCTHNFLRCIFMAGETSGCYFWAGCKFLL